MLSDVRIVAENGRLQEVIVDGHRMRVAPSGLELRLEGSCLELRLTLAVIGLDFTGELPAFVENVLPGDKLVSTSRGVLLATASPRLAPGRKERRL